MSLTPITSVTLATGQAQNVTVVDQNGMALPDGTVAWTQSGTTTVQIVPDTVNGGFTFMGILAGTESLQATHTPSGHTATLPVVVTNPVTAISFATA